jgi:putative FmdB family regulatory protein
MPVYEYKCECGYKFEDLNRMSERHQAECIACGKFAKQVVSAPRIDPNADLPGARMVQRRKMEERGRGKDMWAGNRNIDNEAIDREAHAKRAARNENPIIKS